MCHKHIGERVFSVKHFDHGLFRDFHDGAISRCGCGTQAEGLPCKATISEEIALVENADCGFLPCLRHNSEFYRSFLNIKNGFARVALNKDRLLFGISLNLSPTVDDRQKFLGIEFSKLLGRYHECHSSPPLKSSKCAEDNFLR